MQNTYFSPPDTVLERIAYPFDEEQNMGKPSIQDTFNAADDIYTTISDYAVFTRHVLNSNASALSQKGERWRLAHNLAQRVCASGRLQHEDCPSELGFVSGWSKLAYDDATFYLQGGGDWGEKAMVIMNLEDQKAIIVFTNGANGMHVVHELVDSLFSHSKLSAFIKMQAGG
jgi:CubicO group peptidase (beta-lactamase class C family)